MQGIVIDRDMSEGLLFVANFLRKNGHYDRSEAFCNLLIDYGGQPEREEARSILREIRSILQEKSSLQSLPKGSGTPQSRFGTLEGGHGHSGGSGSGSSSGIGGIGGRSGHDQESKVQESPLDTGSNGSHEYGTPSSDYDRNLLSMSLSPALSED